MHDSCTSECSLRFRVGLYIVIIGWGIGVLIFALTVADSVGSIVAISLPLAFLIGFNAFLVGLFIWKKRREAYGSSQVDAEIATISHNISRADDDDSTPQVQHWSYAVRNDISITTIHSTRNATIPDLPPPYAPPPLYEELIFPHTYAQNSQVKL